MTSEVNLIGVTKPSAITGCHTPGDLVAYTARVSNPTNQSNTQTAPKLLNYLIREKHWSPFEMVHMTLEIKTTRDIARQILRHRSFSFQEFSQRYADPTKDLGFVKREARLQDTKNRQNSIEVENRLLQENWNIRQARVISEAEYAYNWAIENGIAKEQARAVLPEGITQSTLYMAGNLRSWIHYIDLRASNGTQKEHMIIAEQCKKIVLEHFPMLTDYWANNED
jgi:thymidylate synthase (FAD)